MGAYPGAIETDVPAAERHAFFEADGTNYRIKKDLRERVLFATHNVLRDPPFSRLDLVSCRNMPIYLDREVQADVLRMFHFALKPGANRDWCQRLRISLPLLQDIAHLRPDPIDVVGSAGIGAGAFAQAAVVDAHQPGGQTCR